MSDVLDPQWTGAAGEAAICVSRGDPRRTDVQMQQAIHGQIERYLARHTDGEWSDFVISMAAQLIAKHITSNDTTIMLTREHLLEYVELAYSKLLDRSTVEPDPKSGW